MNHDKSILDQNISPFLQAGFVLALMIAFQLFGKIANLCGFEFEATFPWLVSCALLLFFALANAVLSLSANSPNTYWWKSILSYVVLAGTGILLATFFSGLTMYEAGAIKWLYFVISFGYLCFISIVNMMKTVVNIAIKQDKRLRGEE